VLCKNEDIQCPHTGCSTGPLHIPLFMGLRGLLPTLGLPTWKSPTGGPAAPPGILGLCNEPVTLPCRTLPCRALGVANVARNGLRSPFEVGACWPSSVGLDVSSSSSSVFLLESSRSCTSSRCSSSISSSVLLDDCTRLPSFLPLLRCLSGLHT
jgi:hypothetical protein